MIKKLGSNLQTIGKNSLKTDSKPLKASNFVYRVVFGIAMLAVYLFLTSQSTLSIIGISLTLILGIIYELISITKRNDKPLSINKYLVILITSILLLDKVIPALTLFYPKTHIFVQFTHFKPLLFTLYAMSLVGTVVQLSRKNLKSQLLLLMVIHITSYLGGLTFATIMRNINYGKFFFVYPTLLVISNDTFAYFVGKALGKTPLISLSPNKTLEGFIGGFICTFFMGNLICYLKVNNFLFQDPLHRYLEMPLSLENPFLNIPMLYIHNVAFVLAASFLAPFCGFIASAIKRSFQRKDFGSIIPGHGGLTDRFDCQILMVFFTYSYMKVFFNPNRSSAALIYKFLVDNLTDEDLKELCKILTRNE